MYMKPDRKYEEVKQAIMRMVEVLKKYNIRYVLDAPNEPYDWWLSIAIDIDDLYRTLCNEGNKYRPIKCVRARDGFIIGVLEAGDRNIIRENLQKFINSIPYRLHPDFGVSVTNDGVIIAMKIYDADVVSAMFRDVQHIDIDTVRLSGDLWVKVRFLSY